jgi:hypothetical protein
LEEVMESLFVQLLVIGIKILVILGVVLGVGAYLTWWKER